MTPFPPPSGRLARLDPAFATSNALFLFVTLLVMAVSAVFYAYPGIDLTVSAWFYEADEGFTLQTSAPLVALRTSGEWLMRAVALLALVEIARRAWAQRPSRGPLWLLACLLVGPGLLVNGILKAYWGRPRPRQTDIFGGEAPYQKVWIVSDWCEQNCSFVSGEASSAFWLVALALLTPGPYRTPVTALATIYAAAVSLNRVAFGGHYLSDVVLAWLLCALVFLALARLILMPSAEKAE